MEFKMDFKDVENVNKEVIVKIKDGIHLKELVPYMGFTPMTQQGIQAEINNHGESYAVMNFLDAIKRRPGSFPKFIAALNHTKQSEVYEIFMAQIRKKRLAKVLSLISEEEKVLGITGGDDDRADDGDVGRTRASSSGNQASSEGYLSMDGQSMSNPLSDSQLSIEGRSDRGQKEQPVCKMSAPVTPTVPSTNLTSSSSSSLTSLDNNSPGATGKTGPSPQNVSPSSNVDALNPEYAGEPISSLKANVYKMLGQSLERTNTHGDNQEPWWNHIVNNGDLNVSRKEQRQIGRHGSPGVEFLDILDERKYTLEDLRRLFVQFQINEALDILRQHQNKVIPNTTPSRLRDNNLNRIQTTKADTNKNMNISLPKTPQTDGPPGSPVVDNKPSEQSVSRPNSCASNQSMESNVDSSLRTIEDNSLKDLTSTVSRLNSCASNQSMESNPDSSLPSIEDNLKERAPIPACRDLTGTSSQPAPAHDAEKLRNDRINQFDTDPQALENTSFNDVNRSGRPDIVINQTRDDGDGGDDDGDGTQSGEGEQGINTSIQGQGQSDPDTPADSLSQSGSSGNLPCLSGLESFGSNSPVQMRGENHEAIGQRPENIPPRSFTSFEKTVDNFTTGDTNRETGVTCVPPSLESENSREANIRSEFSTRELSEGHLNIQSITSENDQSTESLIEPDLVQGTQSASGGNNDTVTDSKDSKK